jgi:hypothetical protein
MKSLLEEEMKMEKELWYQFCFLVVPDNIKEHGKK